MAIALYNKYRPQIFEDVVGQEQIARTLKNAISTNKTAHAYLFTGPRGTGKTTSARLFSKALLCDVGPTPNPDGTCEDCHLIAAGEHPDVYELDAASRTGVENVREEIIGKVQYAPVRKNKKIYIIDEVHMLSTAAFNALLKTLEEPPEHVVFILCTTDPQKIPETILSRCQRFDFRRIATEEMIARLGAICEMEGVTYDGDALDIIAARSGGGMRDALTSLEQLIAFGDGVVSSETAERLLGSVDSTELAEIVDAIGKHDAARSFKWTAEYMETGADLVQFVQDLTKHMRDMYVMSIAGTDVALPLTEAARRELEAQMPLFGQERLARALDVLGALSVELKASTNQRLSFEVALTRLVRPESDYTFSALAERIENLERALATGGNSVSPQNTSAYATEAPEPAHVEKDDSSQAPKPITQTEPVQQSPQSTSAVGATYSSAAAFWDAAIDQLAKSNPAHASVFKHASVDREGATLIVQFGSDKTFQFKAAQKPDAISKLEDAFTKAGKPNLEYKIIQLDSPVVAQCNTNSSPSPDAADVAASSEPDHNHFVNDAPSPVDAVDNQDVVQTTPDVVAKDDSDNQEASDSPEFAEYLMSAFGDNIVIEEINE